MKIAVHWFRADLRLSDNTALAAAVAESDVVVPVFIFDSRILQAPDTGAPIVGFMLECLRSLEKNVEAAGSKLILRHGAVEEEIAALWEETGAKALYFNRDYEPGARKRDAAVEKLARAMGLEVHSYKDGMLHEPDEVLKEDGQPYRVFTPYARAWRMKARGEVRPVVKFKCPAGFKHARSMALPTAKELGFAVEIPLPPAGERAARARLKQFTAGGLLDYGSRRDFPAVEGTSRLSPHLRLGTLSPRTVLAAADKAAELHPAARKETAVFENELIWRDFYRQILWHYPHVAETSFKEDYADLKWENDERLFAAWCEGRTGFPIVDAGMRQLNATGWMHNRVRMIVAMFLTKDLLVSWQWGERYFMKKLIDADLASNNGGWQWSASTGTDAQPYFRIFNPIAQAERFDPEGEYIHRYVPEVESRDYPAPVVDHGRQRLKALALFKG
jgi:deoxyribodipyrimidine photo-lyase